MALSCLKTVEGRVFSRLGWPGCWRRQVFDPGDLSNVCKARPGRRAGKEALGNLEDTKHSGHRCAFCAQPSGTRVPPRPFGTGASLEAV